MSNVKFLWIVALAINLCTACRNRVEQVNYATTTREHTLLIYMAGDNTLSRYVESNLYSIGQGIKSSEKPVNVVIYRDNHTAANDLPVLYQLKRRVTSERLDTVFLKRWKEEVDSTDPDVIAEVVRLTFTHFDSDIKGMEIWSHALSWIPSDSWTANDDADTRAAQYIGMDGKASCELWDFRRALANSGIKLDYMTFDACHMATAEVAYELRDVCDYILAAPTEIMGEGFPYRQMIPSLSTIRDTATLLPGLTAAYEDFRTAYTNNGTFSILRTAGFQQLHEACVALADQSAEVLAKWRANPLANETKLQRYGRKISSGTSTTGARYYFYDLRDWAEVLGEESGLMANVDAVTSALDECVVASYHSARFEASGGGFDIARSCGVAMSVPEFWSLAMKGNLDAAYSRLEWQVP